ncbi:polyphosphate kinase 1 [Halobium salinum]|uniref:Polyphosphate kinase n=1 Tax=Halobium salinum TaxID=1364940 RepID=A0ABD5P9K6_9EURY|nr:polyphosphate kinase 1 [Halobium salinum]
MSDGHLPDDMSGESTDGADDRTEPDGGDASETESESSPAETESRTEPVDADAVDSNGGDGATEPEPAATDTDDAPVDTDIVDNEHVDTDTVDDEPVDLDDPRYYLNRELSELAFQRRVLHEALDERNPLLERTKFLAIFTQNMDEFFMKRVGGLKQQMDAGVTELTPDGRTPEEQWAEILEESRGLFRDQADCFENAVRPALAEAGVRIVDHDAVDDDQRAALREYFESSVLPTLTPLTFDPAHPFPFISNLSLSLAVLTRGDEDGDGEPDETKFSRVKIPKNRPRFVDADDPGARVEGRESATLVPLEQVVEANLDLLFPNVEVVDTSLFRVTRNAEVRRNEEVAEGLIEMIEDVLRQRRFATVVRLEVDDDMPPEVRELLVDQLGVDEAEVYDRSGLLDYKDLFDLVGLDRADLKLDPWTPQVHPRFANLDPDRPDELFDEIRRGDVLVHHPYHSFTNTVQTFLDAAVNDPDVLAIKAAIYRTASDSQVIESLIEAARNGKQVAVMVELKARFDEENNLRWVKRLEEEGIHVAYGTIGLKTHSKTALVVRDEGDEVQLYSHVATGNYHSETAKTYVDLGLLTADRDIGQDLVKLFNYFTGHSLHEQYRKLLVGPENMRDRFSRLVDREAEHARAGRDARIVAKLNSLEDPEMVKKLYEASMAGVEVDLVVRGICRLRPGIEGVSDTVSVSSVVGRFLEHSRIYYFENGGGSKTPQATDEAGEAGEVGDEADPEYYLGSADWMTRNLDRRVEAVTPVEDPDIRAELEFVLDTMLSDNRKRWVMDEDGNYEQCRPEEGDPVVNTHRRLMHRAKESVPEEEPLTEHTRREPAREPSVDLEGTFTDGQP